MLEKILDFIINACAMNYGIKKSKEWQYNQYTGSMKKKNKQITNEKAKKFYEGLTDEQKKNLLDL